MIVPSSEVPWQSQTSQVSATEPPLTRPCPATCPTPRANPATQTALLALLSLRRFIGIRRPSAPATTSPLRLPSLLRLRPALGGLIVVQMMCGVRALDAKNTCSEKKNKLFSASPLLREDLEKCLPGHHELPPNEAFRVSPVPLNPEDYYCCHDHARMNRLVRFGAEALKPQKVAGAHKWRTPKVSRRKANVLRKKALRDGSYGSVVVDEGVTTGGGEVGQGQERSRSAGARG